MDLNGTKTHENLKAAFGQTSMANRRYLYFAEVADVDGFPEVAAGLREAAAGSTGHANGILDYLIDAGDPTTDHPIGETVDNLGSAVIGETLESTERYPTMAEAARAEGFTEIAEWFDSLALAAKAKAERLRNLLDTVD